MPDVTYFYRMISDAFKLLSREDQNGGKNLLERFLLKTVPRCSRGQEYHIRVKPLGVLAYKRSRKAENGL